MFHIRGVRLESNDSEKSSVVANNEKGYVWLDVAFLSEQRSRLQTHEQ